MKFNILILDDEQLVCKSLKRIIDGKDRQVFTANSYKEAEKLLKEESMDLMLLDYKLGEMDGISVLKELNGKYESLLVIMITAYGSIDVAVEAMKLGAYDFIQKKVDPDFIRYTVQRALDNLRLKKEVDELKTTFQDNICMPRMVATSLKMKSVLKLAGEYSKSDSTVLIQGETGTGKGIMAELIHYKSARFNQPFVPINISAIPKELIESELFGYEKGAFTGASQQGKSGLIERANGGTLFLDEIGDLDLDIQSKLLHVLEKNEFFRLGTVKSTKVNVRFIAATNSNIEELVSQKKFRMDLFYRINVANLEIPPLRDRKEDILPLTKYFIDEFNNKFNKSVTDISDKAEMYLNSSFWKGNIRELKNRIEKAILLIKNNCLELNDINEKKYSIDTNDIIESNNQFNLNLNAKSGINILQEGNKQLIKQALEIAKNNVTQASKILGIPRTTLTFYLKKYNILK